MEFSDKELRMLLQALYRFRGEVSGFSQSKQNKLGLVESVIGRIEGKVGPATAEKTKFDREMEESLSVLKTGRAGAAKKAATAKQEPAPAKAKTAPRGAKAASKLDKPAAVSKVKKSAGPKKAAPVAKKAAGASRSGVAKDKAK